MSESQLTDFANTLLSERKRLGLTQPACAALLGIPSRTYWEWENGKTPAHEITKEGAISRLKDMPTPT